MNIRQELGIFCGLLWLLLSELTPAWLTLATCVFCRAATQWCTLHVRRWGRSWAQEHRSSCCGRLLSLVPMRPLQCAYVGHCWRSACWFDPFTRARYGYHLPMGKPAKPACASEHALKDRHRTWWTGIEERAEPGQWTHCSALQRGLRARF